RCGAIATVGRSTRLKIVNTDLIRRMHVPAGVRPQRPNVTAVAPRLAVEQLFASVSGRGMEGVGGRFRRRDRQLVKLQVRELRGDAVIAWADMREVANAAPDGHRELHRVVQSSVEESSNATHVKVRDKGIPVRDRSPPGPGMQVDAAEPESRWDQRGAR